MSKISNGGLVGLFYNDFNQRQKSGLWSLEDHAADKNYIRSSQIPNNYLVVGSYNTDSLYLYDLFFKNKVSTNIFNIPISTITSIDYNYKTNKLAFGLNKAPYLKLFNTTDFTEYTLTKTLTTPVNCLKFNSDGTHLFIGYLELQENTYIKVYNIEELTTPVQTNSYFGSQGNQGSQGSAYIIQNITYSNYDILLEYMPTCIKFTKDDNYLCVGHYGTIENEFKNISLYKLNNSVYEDISEYNLNNFELQTVTDICFIDDLKLLFISSYNNPYINCYNYERQDPVSSYNSIISVNITSVPNSLLLSKDNRKLFIGCNIEPYLYILDIDTKNITTVTDSNIDSSIVSMSFSYNDQYLCISTKSGMKLFDYSLKTFEPVNLNILPETTSFSSAFLFGPLIEYVEIEKPLYSVSSNDNGIVAITSADELAFTGTFLTEGVSTPSPDLAAHKNIFQTQIYFSLDFNSTYITSINLDGTLITNDINISNSYNNIIQIQSYYSRIALLDQYNSVHIPENNSYDIEEKYYITNYFNKNVKKIALGNTLLIALTINNQILSSNLTLFDPDILVLPEIKDIAAGESHVALLTFSNTVLCYGNSEYNQLNTQNWTNIKKVCCGDKFTLGLTLTNQLVISGQVLHEQEILSEQDVIDIFCGPTDIMLVKSNNTVKVYTPFTTKIINL